MTQLSDSWKLGDVRDVEKRGSADSPEAVMREALTQLSTIRFAGSAPLSDYAKAVNRIARTALAKANTDTKP